MNKIVFSAVLGSLLTLLSVQLFDLPLATWIAKYLGVYAPHIKTSEIPDLLPIIVVVLTSLSWGGYFYLRQRNVTDKRIIFLRLLGTVLPLTFIVKVVLKWLFGRVDTRFWLYDPNQFHGFHWLAGTGNFQGFPSGHMLVFTPLLMALWYFYPRYRNYYVASFLALAFALIFTEYHFLGDVIAGACVGAILYWLVATKLDK